MPATSTYSQAPAPTRDQAQPDEIPLQDGSADTLISLTAGPE